MVHIAKTTESTVHSETLSRQYLETVKSMKTIEGVKCDNSKNNNRDRSRSQSLHVDVHLTLVATVDTNTLPESAKLTKKSVISVAK